jgi:hypothetical protein
MKITFNKEKLLTRDTLLTALLVIVVVLSVNAMLPVRVDPNLTEVISKNRAAIRDLHKTRKIETTKTVKMYVLNLHDKNRFLHPKLGDIGFGTNFFADVETQFVVRRAGNYRFVVASDDGFSLRINDRELCSFTGARPIATQTCNVHLAEGEHNFKLSYFQGGGFAGLTVRYGLQNDRRLYWFGEDSSLLRIKR